MNQTFRIKNDLQSGFIWKSKVDFNADNYKKFNYMSIVSCRFKNIFQNTGQLILDTDVDGTITRTAFNLSYEPQGFDDLVFQLNQLNPTVWQFGMVDDDDVATTSATATKLYVQFLDASVNKIYSLQATGNLQNILGLHELIDGIEDDTITVLEEDNSMRIEYIQLKSDSVYGNFQCQNSFDQSVLCITDRTTGFEYSNKNLDVNMPIDGNKFTFQIVDQTGRAIKLTYMFLEFILFDEQYFRDSLLMHGVHEKTQSYMHLTPTNNKAQFSKKLNKVCISDISGRMPNQQMTQANSQFKLLYYSGKEHIESKGEDLINVIQNMTVGNPTPFFYYDYQDSATTFVNSNFYDIDDFAAYKNKLLDTTFFQILGNYLKTICTDMVVDIYYVNDYLHFDFRNACTGAVPNPETLCFYHFQVESTNLLYNICKENPNLIFENLTSFHCSVRGYTSISPLKSRLSILTTPPRRDFRYLYYNGNLLTNAYSLPPTRDPYIDGGVQKVLIYERHHTLTNIFLTEYLSSQPKVMSTDLTNEWGFYGTTAEPRTSTIIAGRPRIYNVVYSGATMNAYTGNKIDIATYANTYANTPVGWVDGQFNIAPSLTGTASTDYAKLYYIYYLLDNGAASSGWMIGYAPSLDYRYLAKDQTLYTWIGYNIDSFLMFSYSRIFEIYSPQVSDIQPLAVVIMGDDLILQKCNKSVFTWDVLAEPIQNLTFYVRIYQETYESPMQEILTTNFPDMILRLLVK